MSGSASLAVEQGMLSHTLGIGPVAAVTRAWVALCLASPVPDEQTAGREVTGNGYARVSADFQILDTPPNTAANGATVAFPIAAAPWGVLGWFELWDAPAGGVRLYWGALVDPTDGTTPIAVSVAGGDVLRFSSGALAVRIGPPGARSSSGYVLPVATTTVLGGVKPDGRTINVGIDGVISTAAGGGGGLPEAPLDGAAYGRQSAAWNRVLAATNDVVDGGNF